MIYSSVRFRGCIASYWKYTTWFSVVIIKLTPRFFLFKCLHSLVNAVVTEKAGEKGPGGVGR